MKNNPDFATALEEQQRARKYYDEVMHSNDANNSDIGVCRNHISESEKQLKQLAAEIYLMQQKYDAGCFEHLEWKRPMLEEYEKLKKRQGDFRRCCTAG